MAGATDGVVGLYPTIPAIPYHGVLDYTLPWCVGLYPTMVCCRRCNRMRRTRDSSFVWLDCAAAVCLLCGLCLFAVCGVLSVRYHCKPAVPGQVRSYHTMDCIPTPRPSSRCFLFVRTMTLHSCCPCCPQTKIILYCFSDKGCDGWTEGSCQFHRSIASH